MRMVTFKLKPKMIFGLVMLLTGVVVAVVSFVGNHSAKPAVANQNISCTTTQKRVDYLNSLGYKTDSKEDSKQITIPAKFNDVYNNYNDIQKQQGFDLTAYKGKTATLYTYNILNYEDNDNVVANLIVYNGILIGADLCDVSADDGFLVALNGQNRQDISKKS